MTILGRSLVWLYAMVFIATVSCALACSKLEAVQASEMCPKSQQGCGGTEQPLEDRCLRCVYTHFVAQTKFLNTFIAIPLRGFDLTNLSSIDPSGRPLPSPAVLTGQVIFLKNSVLLI